MRVSYGTPTFIICDENIQQMQLGTTKWYKDGTPLAPPKPHLVFTDDGIIDILFTTIEHEGEYNCTYQQDLHISSTVIGNPSPRFLVVVGEENNSNHCFCAVDDVVLKRV